MRGLVLTTGTLLAAGFVLLGTLVLLMGEGQVPTGGIDIRAFGAPAYAIGVAWIALGIAIFCVGLLGAEVGAKYYVRKTRDWSFLVFGGGLVLAVSMVALKLYGNVAL